MNRVFTRNSWGNPEVELKWVKYAIGTLRLGSILELIYQIWIIYPIENLILFRVQLFHISCLNFSWQNILLVKVSVPVFQKQTTVFVIKSASSWYLCNAIIIKLGHLTAILLGQWANIKSLPKVRWTTE